MFHLSDSDLLEDSNIRVDTRSLVDDWVTVFLSCTVRGDKCRN